MEQPQKQRRRILVSGSTGLIGRAVTEARRAVGDEVVALVRSGEAPGAVHWSPDGQLDPEAVSGFDAVVHLAGEPVANGRWTAAKKQRIRDSRVEGTRKLVSALRAAAQPPRAFLCASGINFYGSQGDALLDESSPHGRGFLTEVCTEGEAAAAALDERSRVVVLRIGAVLSPEGGTLAAMLPLFRMGLAGPIAGGNNFVSWVTLADVVRAISYLIDSSALSGPVNVVSPEPVRGRQFIAAMAAAVNKLAVLPVPGWAARLMMGEIANETVLASVRALPKRLLDDGFVFEQPELHGALDTFNLRYPSK